MISIPSILQALWLVVLFNGNPVTLNTQQTQDFHLRVAWSAAGERVWFVPFAASDPQVAKLLDYARQTFEFPVPVDWSLALKCALEKDVLNDVYFINCGQSIIFTSEPGDPCYTPLWRVHYLEFCNAPPRPIHTLDEVLAAIDSGELEQIREDSVLNAPIVIDSQRNVIPQAQGVNLGRQTIKLPLIKVFFKIRFQPMTMIGYVPFTDTSDADIAARLGANYAPRLLNLADDCCDPVYAFVDPTAPGQLPIIGQVQEYRGIDGLQVNRQYTPLRCWYLFDREDPCCGFGMNPVIKNQAVTDIYVDRGVVTPVELDEPIVTNSPLVPVDCRFY